MKTVYAHSESIASLRDMINFSKNGLIGRPTIRLDMGQDDCYIFFPGNPQKNILARKFFVYNKQEHEVTGYTSPIQVDVKDSAVEVPEDLEIIPYSEWLTSRK